MTASRFAGSTRTRAIAVIAALSAILLIGAFRSPAAAPLPLATSAAPMNAHNDLVLYSKITARVAAGESYYRVAADEQRRNDYPLRPFVTMRLPTLAIVSVALGPIATAALLYVLVLLTLLTWWHRLAGSYDDHGRRISALGLLMAGTIVALVPEFAVLHEVWSGILIALAFGLHRPDRWLASALIGACALFIRELALPYILLMGAFAVWDRRWREVFTLAAMVMAFAVAMAVHAHYVAGVTNMADPASPGWAAFGGWQSFMRFMQMPSALRSLPESVASAIIILSLFGWLSWPTRAGLFATLFFAGYGVLFMILGRPANFYWGFIVAPVFLVGLTFLPHALCDLRKAMIAGPQRAVAAC